MCVDLCKKHQQTAFFWCKQHSGHDGLCVNGVMYSSEPYRGNADDLLKDIEALTDSIADLTDRDCGRKSSEWASNARRAYVQAQHLKNRLRWAKENGVNLDCVAQV